MARITVLGGTGYAGAAIVAEAARRGHVVTAVSRSKPDQPTEGVTYTAASVLDADTLGAVVNDSDVIVSALSPRGDMAGKVEGVIEELARLVDGTGVRLGHVGGASSLLVAPEGPRLWDVSREHIPEDVRPEIETGLNILDLMQATPDSVDWFYVSPPENFGAWVPAPVTGSYRLGRDVLVRDENGTSIISAADLALAILDEIETPSHRRARFTAAH